MVYGTPTDPVAGTVITVAFAVANFLEPIRALRAFTGGADPPGTGYVVSSDSTSATSWKTIPAALGYTPVNKAGDTMSGNLAFSDILEGLVLSGGSRVRDDHTAGTGHLQILSHNNRLAVYRADASALLADFNNGALTITGLMSAGSVSAAGITGSAITSTGNLLVGGTTTANAINAGAISGSTGSFSGAVTAPSATLTGNAQASQLVSTVATGTPPLVVTSSTVVPNLNANQLGGSLASAFAGVAHTHVANAQIVSGTYTGNGAATQDITGLGFQPKFVWVHRQGTGAWTYDASGYMTAFFAAGPEIREETPSAILATGFRAYLGRGNDSGVTYYYVAIG